MSKQRKNYSKNNYSKPKPNEFALHGLGRRAQIFMRIHTRGQVTEHLGISLRQYEGQLNELVLPFCVKVLRAVRVLKHSKEGQSHIRTLLNQMNLTREDAPLAADAMFLDSYLKANSALTFHVGGEALDAALCFAALAVVSERIPHSLRSRTWSGWTNLRFAPIESLAFGLSLEYGALARVEKESRSNPVSTIPPGQSLAEKSKAASALASGKRPGRSLAAEIREREMLEYLRNAVEAEALKTGRPIDSPKRAAGMLTDQQVEYVWAKWKRRVANVKGPGWDATIEHFRKFYARSYGDKYPRPGEPAGTDTGNPDKG